MSEKTKLQLTREWIMVMLYEDNQTRGELIDIGCKSMVYGWEYDELKQIFEGMSDENFIRLSPVDDTYRLTEKGRFTIKKNALLPLETLVTKPGLIADFISAYKDKCDTDFLNTLVGAGPTTRLERIKNYAQQNYGRIAEIVQIFLSNYDYP